MSPCSYKYVLKFASGLRLLDPTVGQAKCFQRKNHNCPGLGLHYAWKLAPVTKNIFFFILWFKQAIV